MSVIHSDENLTKVADSFIEEIKRILSDLNSAKLTKFESCELSYSKDRCVRLELNTKTTLTIALWEGK